MGGGGQASLHRRLADLVISRDRPVCGTWKSKRRAGEVMRGLRTHVHDERPPAGNGP
jgi:hypothetical protein